ncbi:hypothetical protein L249_6287 [Ophiocordyceps polyrhachis-furcata BCC 54312]|uniref:Uncharacterized protein n=1 Tax=Ophiocordyceps polyrhachis-furcata BCC 54312 TaxID=1330021 RepID=A0A367L1A9_9HYPO|nr:hypothetical protein L249_6287 [Ophiocordyceps polyrhachis-furcata BCC 54312]
MDTRSQIAYVDSGQRTLLSETRAQTGLRTAKSHLLKILSSRISSPAITPYHMPRGLHTEHRLHHLSSDIARNTIHPSPPCHAPTLHPAGPPWSVRLLTAAPVPGRRHARQVTFLFPSFSLSLMLALRHLSSLVKVPRPEIIIIIIIIIISVGDARPFEKKMLIGTAHLTMPYGLPSRLGNGFGPLTTQRKPLLIPFSNRLACRMITGPLVISHWPVVLHYTLMHRQSTGLVRPDWAYKLHVCTPWTTIPSRHRTLHPLAAPSNLVYHMICYPHVHSADGSEDKQHHWDPHPISAQLLLALSAFHRMLPSPPSFALIDVSPWSEPRSESLILNVPGGWRRGHHVPCPAFNLLPPHQESLVSVSARNRAATSPSRNPAMAAAVSSTSYVMRPSVARHS